MLSHKGNIPLDHAPSELSIFMGIAPVHSKVDTLSLIVSRWRRSLAPFRGAVSRSRFWVNFIFKHSNREGLAISDFRRPTKPRFARKDLSKPDLQAFGCFSVEILQGGFQSAFR
jgi:hypothetical protein